LLEEGDIVIEDSSRKIIDLCGIMGGKLSEITPETKNVLFIVANDYFAQIRKTCMRLGLQTEASARLTKVLNPEVVYPTMLRGIQLFIKHANATVDSKIVDIYPHPQKIPTITLTDQFLSQKIGKKIDPKTTDRILKTLGFTVKRQGNQLVVRPPIWRINDISIPEDIVEEVARINNYDTIPNLPLKFELPPKPKHFLKMFKWENKTRDILVHWGLSETISYSVISEKQLKDCCFSPKGSIKLANPLTKEWEFMQPSLIPNLIKNIKENQRVNRIVKIFEIANVFDKKGQEKRNLVIGIGDDQLDVLKGIVEQLLNAIRVKTAKFESGSHFAFEKDRTIQVNIEKGKVAGFLGPIKEEVLENHQMKTTIVAAELDLGKLIQNIDEQPKRYRPLSKYTPIIEDLSLKIPSQIYYQQVYELISSFPNIERVEFIDHFQHYFTFRIFYQLKNKQISSEEARSIRQKLLKRLDRKLGVKLRG
jgi:phenylalanyl-tRNA synthetase beta chain